jgi:hypothetical protein
VFVWHRKKFSKRFVCSILTVPKSWNGSAKNGDGPWGEIDVAVETGIAVCLPNEVVVVTHVGSPEVAIRIEDRVVAVEVEVILDGDMAVVVIRIIEDKVVVVVVLGGMVETRIGGIDKMGVAFGWERRRAWIGDWVVRLEHRCGKKGLPKTFHAVRV